MKWMSSFKLSLKTVSWFVGSLLEASGIVVAVCSLFWVFLLSSGHQVSTLGLQRPRMNLANIKMMTLYGSETLKTSAENDTNIRE